MPPRTWTCPSQTATCSSTPQRTSRFQFFIPLSILSNTGQVDSAAARASQAHLVRFALLRIGQSHRLASGPILAPEPIGRAESSRARLAAHDKFRCGSTSAAPAALALRDHRKGSVQSRHCCMTSCTAASSTHCSRGRRTMRIQRRRAPPLCALQLSPRRFRRCRSRRCRRARGSRRHGGCASTSMR
jgi:hypothetical protein